MRSPTLLLALIQILAYTAYASMWFQCTYCCLKLVRSVCDLLRQMHAYIELECGSSTGIEVGLCSCLPGMAW